MSNPATVPHSSLAFPSLSPLASLAGTLDHNLPIGVFDSGVGGLTVVKQLIELLPNESLVYFGDTIHLPYGDKSQATIIGYVQHILDFLYRHPVKMILIACNSATAALHGYLGDQPLYRNIPIINVVDPMVELLAAQYNGHRVGLIGTKLTVASQLYPRRLLATGAQIQLQALATPLLVPIIEEDFPNLQLLELALREYLTHPTLQNISALVLACTHYPLMRQQLEDFYGSSIEILDSAKVTAHQVKHLLNTHNLLADRTAEYHFYLSELTDSFRHQVSLFLGAEITTLQKINIF